MYRKTHLPNGTRIISHAMPKMQSVALGIWIRVGGRYETAGNKGISHYLEHLLFKGTRKYSLRRLKESIEGVGGSLNGFTSEEATCYLVKLPAKHMALGLDVLSDMVINPLLPAEEVEKERTVILEELKMYKDQPQNHVYDLLDELLWPGQIMGMSIIGTVESVSAISRQDLADFKNNCYTPSNIVISAAGALAHDRLAGKVRGFFAGLKERAGNKFIPVREGQSLPQLKIMHKDTEQSHIALGFHSLKRGDPLRHAQGLLHIILGGNMSSRLFNEVREKKGLAYEIGTTSKRFEDTGAFIVHAGIDNLKVEEAIEVILAELAKTKDRLVSEDEFRRAKEFYTGQLELALEDTMDHMLWIGEPAVTLDKVQTPRELLKEVSSLRRQDVREVACRIFHEGKINLAVIGPLQGREEEIRKRLKVA